jgi:hypothetical protein
MVWNIMCKFDEIEINLNILSQSVFRRFHVTPEN